MSFLLFVDFRMPRRRGRSRPPVMADSTESVENDHRAVTNKAVSTMKRCHSSDLSTAKSQQCSDSNDYAASEKCRSWTTGIKQPAACINNDADSSSNITSADREQLSEDTTNAALGWRLQATFFDQPCVELARNLLGKYIVRISPEDGKRLSGRIVETEAYVGLEDRASHSYGGRRTARNEAMYMPPGTSYVYNIYGIYTCINISSRGMLDL